MTDKHDEVSEKEPRLLGKWDYIVCTLLTVLLGLGDHTLLAGAGGIGFALGRFIVILLVWALIKMLILKIKGKAAAR